jgi:nucleotide-binding universal stress UspA family protein
MSIFPTKILLATDGSREAELAARTAADLAQKTDSELHVLHVLASPLATHDPSSFEPEVWARLEHRESKRPWRMWWGRSRPLAEWWKALTTQQGVQPRR